MGKHSKDAPPPRPKFCDKCGTKNRPKAEKCKECGNRLDFNT